MALKKSSGQSDLRIYERSFACEYSSREEDAVHRSRLMDKIHSAYSKAFERLAISSKVGRRPVAMRILGNDGGGGGGFGFGLLDPTSNIIANSLIPCKRDPAATAAAAEKGGGKGEAAGACGVEEELRDLVRRSLEGMVTFLTRFFPYLADCEAVFYLLLADADLLVATRIIVADRRMKRFGSSEPAVEEALRCAALAAQHPDPDRFVGAWLAISSRLDEAVSLLAKVRRRSPASSLHNLERLLRGPPPQVDDRRGDLLLAWQRAMSRPPLPRSVPYQNTSTGLKRALLDAIHGFYLQALARLPAGQLRSRYRRSLLMAGHCYGPLDPISNIILNTIWYDAAFPPAMELELDMVISTPGLLRIETRSMYGLVSFLCTRYHHLNFHRATRCLLEADGSLLLADPNLDAEAAVATIAISRMKEPTRLHTPWSTDTGFHSALGSRVRVATQTQLPATSVNEAFKAAATAAWHPNADAQANLFTSCKKMLGSVLPLLQGGSPLSTEDAQRLARLLISPDESPCKTPPPIPLPSKECVRAHTTITEKVNAVLNVYASMPNGEPTYELHAICSVNDQVSGPVYCPESGACPPVKFYRSHVNFLATPRYSRSHGNEVPVLFFAEFINDDDKAQPLSCPLCIPPPCSERVRCLYCDFVGIRIIHPIGKNFHGREEDFENMVCKKDPFDEDFDPALVPQYYTNTAIISHSKIMAEQIGWLEEDRLYESSEDDSDSDYMSDEC
ncbi:unnamed protein product [Urochloa humidicola]